MKMLKNTLFAGIKAKNKDSYLYQNNRPYMVRVARLELAASWSQTRRPTNWATPGYEIEGIFPKWSNMWSRAILDQSRGEVKKKKCQRRNGFSG